MPQEPTAKLCRLCAMHPGWTWDLSGCTLCSVSKNRLLGSFKSCGAHENPLTYFSFETHFSLHKLRPKVRCAYFTTASKYLRFLYPDFQLDPANSNTVISHSPIFRAQLYFLWMCPRGSGHFIFQPFTIGYVELVWSNYSSPRTYFGPLAWNQLVSVPNFFGRLQK